MPVVQRCLNIRCHGCSLKWSDSRFSRQSESLFFLSMTIFFVTKNELVTFLFVSVMRCFLRLCPIENHLVSSKKLFIRSYSFAHPNDNQWSSHFLSETFSLYLYSKKTQPGKRKERNVYVTERRYRQRLEWTRVDWIFASTFTVINDHGEVTRNSMLRPDWSHLGYATVLASRVAEENGVHWYDWQRVPSDSWSLDKQRVEDRVATPMNHNSQYRSAVLLIFVVTHADADEYRRHCSNFRNRSYWIADDCYCSWASTHHAWRLESKERKVTVMVERREQVDVPRWLLAIFRLFWNQWVTIASVTRSRSFRCSLVPSRRVRASLQFRARSSRRRGSG